MNTTQEMCPTSGRQQHRIGKAPTFLFTLENTSENPGRVSYRGAAFTESVIRLDSSPFVERRKVNFLCNDVTS